MAENSKKTNNEQKTNYSVGDLDGYVKRFGNVVKDDKAKPASKRARKSSKIDKTFAPVVVSSNKKNGSKKSGTQKSRKAIAGNGLSSRKPCDKLTTCSEKKQSKPKPKPKKGITEKPSESQKNLVKDAIYLNESDGLYYDTATGVALKDMFSDEEKKDYCDKKYGKGNWKKLSKSELRRRFQIEMELKEIENSFNY